MAINNIIARVVLTPTTNISRDISTNTYNFYSPVGVDVSDLDNVVDMLTNLYTVVPPGGNRAIGGYISSSMQREGRIIFYNRDDPHPRAPIFEDTFTMPAPGAGSDLPAEVALVASFQGTRASGVSQARRRGRVFLGPLRAPGTSFLNPPTAMVEDIVKSFQQLKAESDASISFQWRIWSEANGNSVLIDNGWIDNAWDNQRRRGPRPTARTTWS